MLARQLPQVNIVLQAVIGRSVGTTSCAAEMRKRLALPKLQTYDDSQSDDDSSLGVTTPRAEDVEDFDIVSEHAREILHRVREHERLQRRAYWWQYEAARGVGMGSQRARQVFGVAVALTHCVAAPLGMGVLFMMVTIGLWSIIVQLGLGFVAFVIQMCVYAELVLG